MLLPGWVVRDRMKRADNGTAFIFLFLSSLKCINVQLFRSSIILYDEKVILSTRRPDPRGNVPAALEKTKNVGAGLFIILSVNWRLFCWLVVCVDTPVDLPPGGGFSMCCAWMIRSIGDC
jgi:hypothetical protein